MPAALAIDTHAAASNFTGLKNGGRSRSYSRIVKRWFCITHSPSPRTEYVPQWMKRPKRFSWNHWRAFKLSGVGMYVDCADAVEARSAAATIESLMAGRIRHLDCSSADASRAARPGRARSRHVEEDREDRPDRGSA